MEGSPFQRFQTNDGGSVPTIAFGTGTTFFNRNDDVCEAILKAQWITFEIGRAFLRRDLGI